MKTEEISTTTTRTHIYTHVGLIDRSVLSHIARVMFFFGLLFSLFFFWKGVSLGAWIYGRS